MAGLMNKGIVKAASFMNLKNRLNYFKVAPEAMEHIMALEKYVRKTKIDRQLKALIKVYVSQLNGCSYCIEMHTKEAKKLKISDKVLNELENWRENKLFEDMERVSLELAEHITHISNLRVNDELYHRVREFYGEKEYFDLVMVINQINLWNRLSISMGNTASN
ncbi:carboxymuconolactone decarboxylase family protein [Virgibacillus ainsalahensis]